MFLLFIKYEYWHTLFTVQFWAHAMKQRIGHLSFDSQTSLQCAVWRVGCAFFQIQQCASVPVY